MPKNGFSGAVKKVLNILYSNPGKLLRFSLFQHLKQEVNKRDIKTACIASLLNENSSELPELAFWLSTQQNTPKLPVIGNLPIIDNWQLPNITELSAVL